MGGLRRRVLAALVATVASSPYPAAGQASACTSGPVLPAYSHNDYANRHPLYDALELGFRGVEADVLLRGGELRVAHDASATRPGRNLEALYLRPLRAIVRQCGHVLAASTPFLLNVELKERSPASYDSLHALLERYPDLFEQPPGDLDGPPVEIILVGWYPPLADSTPNLGHQLRRQQHITTLSPGSRTDSTTAVRLVSLDYGKTIGWSGRGPLPERAASWLARLRAAKGQGPDRLARAYNVPVDPAVYRLLLEAGVDLIGTKRLLASQQVLLTLGATSLRPYLTGRWHAWFRLDSASRLPLATRAHEVMGEVRFSSARWRRVHAGTTSIEFRPFGFVLGSAETLGWYEGRDTVRIIFDPTVDHGHVELVGSAEADAVVGRWRLNSDLARAEGEFRLRRLARE